MAQKPSIPKGTRDFSPTEVAKRNYIIQKIKKHFEVYGFQPIETPSFENSETLMGKYGDEGDRLIFKILDSGDYFGKVKGEIERTFLLKAAIKKSFRSLNEYGINSNFFREIDSQEGKMLIVDYYDFKGREEELGFHDFVMSGKEPIAIENIDELVNDLTIKFASLLKTNLEDNFTSKDDFDYVESILSKINGQELIREKYLPYLRSLSKRITIKQILNPKERTDKVPDFSKEVVEIILGKKLNLVVPTTKEVTSKISEKALRYDLTVPFARYVVMHQNEIDFPFKRYQIQPVWRADRPQKGRFREFYQCDADVVGSKSLLQEVELVQLYDAVFTDLKLVGTTIKLNNRKILSGIAEVIGAKQLLIDFTVALDKLDKIGEEGVKKEMLSKGISESAITKASPLFAMSGSSLEQLAQLKLLLAESEIGMHGVTELEEIINTVEEIGLKSASIQVDVTLARGLNYYTGAIFEVSAPEGVHMGSIGGGGRYDDLTGIFGLKDVSGIGISFGLDRIYLVMEELGLFPERLNQSIDVLCINFGKKESLASLKLVGKLRENGIKAEVYPSAAKMQKQMKYANNRKVPYVVMIGEQELSKQEFVVKTMSNGEQETYSLDSLEEFGSRLRST